MRAHKIIADNVLLLTKKSNVKQIYFSGIEDLNLIKNISKVAPLSMYGNGVTFLSSKTYDYIAGKKLDEIKFKFEYEKNLRFALKYMGTNLDKLATLLLIKKMLPYLSANNLYNDRIINNYKEEFARLHLKQKEIIKCLNLKFADSYNLPFIDYVKLAVENNESLLICDLTNTKKLDIFDNLFIDNKIHLKFNEKELFQVLSSAMCKFIIVSGNELVGFDSLKKLKINGVSHIYSNIEYEKQFLSPSSKISSNLSLKKIGRNDTIKNIAIAELTKSEFNTLRDLYISKNVKGRAAPGKRYGLFSDGKIFGAFGLATDYNFKTPQALEKPTVYLLSDFTVSPTCEKHLSKLVLYSVLSKEVKLLAERFISKEVKTVYTTVFSDKNVSMKYRDLFRLYSRKNENEINVLGYGANMGKWTLAEGYELWKQK